MRELPCFAVVAPFDESTTWFAAPGAKSFGTWAPSENAIFSLRSIHRLGISSVFDRHSVHTRYRNNLHSRVRARNSVS
jgi:hypothetical protein